MASNGKTIPPKKTYRSPALVVYGSIEAITKTIGTGNVTDGTGGGQTTKNKSR